MNPKKARHLVADVSPFLYSCFQAFGHYLSEVFSILLRKGFRAFCALFGFAHLGANKTLGQQFVDIFQSVFFATVMKDPGLFTKD